MGILVSSSSFFHSFPRKTKLFQALVFFFVICFGKVSSSIDGLGSSSTRWEEEGGWYTRIIIIIKKTRDEAQEETRHTAKLEKRDGCFKQGIKWPNAQSHGTGTNSKFAMHITRRLTWLYVHKFDLHTSSIVAAGMGGGNRKIELLLLLLLNLAESSSSSTVKCVGGWGVYAAHNHIDWMAISVISNRHIYMYSVQRKKERNIL